MDRLTAFLLGLIQGLSEFLPISSSGHLVMAQEVLGVDAGGVLFEVVVHVGTLAAVLLFYRQRLTALLRGALARDPATWSYVAKLAVGTLPAVAAALFARDFFTGLFERPWVSGAALLATGAILWTTRRTAGRAHREEPGFLAALLIGCAQAAAIVPGISRSGATVAAALALGVRSERAAEFSFLLSIPAILGAALLSVPELEGAAPETRGALAIGALAALGSGFFALRWFVALLRTGAFYRFAHYDWAVGALFLTWLALR